MEKEDFVFNIIKDNIDIKDFNNKYLCILYFSNDKNIDYIINNFYIYENFSKPTKQRTFMITNLSNCRKFRDIPINNICTTMVRLKDGYLCNRCSGKPCFVYEIDYNSILNSLNCNLKLLDNI